MVAAQFRRPLDSDRVPALTGQVFVIVERCKGGRFGAGFCPEEVLAESTGMNARGYHYLVVAPGKGSACKGGSRQPGLGGEGGGVKKMCRNAGAHECDEVATITGQG